MLVYTTQLAVYPLAWQHVHVQLWIRTCGHTCIGRILSMTWPCCWKWKWKYVSRSMELFSSSTSFFQPLLQIGRGSLFCSTNALASDTNHYLFARSFTSFRFATSRLHFRFHFRFLPLTSSYVVTEQRFFGHQRRYTILYVEKWTNENWRKSIAVRKFPANSFVHPLLWFLQRRLSSINFD